MPIHDWTKVPAGIFHHFHGAWLFELARELNASVLPSGYYALGEQVITGAVPDVLTLERSGIPSPPAPIEKPGSLSPEPTATITALAQDPTYSPRPRVLAIRHVSDDRVVAIVEIISLANKKDAAELGAVVEKTVFTLSKGIHVIIIDLHPPGTYAPEGLEGLPNVIWRELGQKPTKFDDTRPLQVVSYACGEGIKAYIEPRAVGEELPKIPLFLSRGQYVRLPLEETYRSAFASLPEHLRLSLE